MNLRAEPPTIPFIDLAAQRRRLGSAIDEAVLKVVNSCQFILGPEVREFEAQLATFAGTKHAVSCASGTDALVLPLRAMGIGPGDAVICPSFTFCATAEVVALVGATPVYVDVDPVTFNMNPDHIAGAVETARELGLKPKAVIPVDLFGQAAEHGPIAAAAKAYDLFVIDDAAQGFGATYNNRRIGAFGHVTATSFFPAKPLGCYGDGGAALTDDDNLADLMRSVRVHGAGSDRYDNVRIGLTSRLDTIQAAVLIEKLKIFPDEIDARERIARRYNEALRDVVTVPVVPAGMSSVWAQYTIRLKPGRRDAFAAALKAEGIPTAIYYPIPLHRQQAYKQYPVGKGGVAVSEVLAQEVISLPMHAYLDEPTQDRIIDAVRRAVKAG
ncbi:DegT/DnrJ/EryC1/StrS family aminotransferase [Undibacter mobilis]|uniref:DegT/DnrJ/EryC1/StrS family aminotransferase n=1 Tax=Undibacter mobilis TaxID=2292256 RepID=A0A371BC03_9BRAD|nr:DegT/DnrJ/EryC1/StrS family aminotransferase [Undibacter mobilis]RDV05116.1 DegT/DnrJ/EryC1/StrS family aminotransferase [Undibacter mobilis]